MARLTGFAAVILAGIFLATQSLAQSPEPAASVEHVRIFEAAKIITMDTARPAARFVAVSDGRIVGLGDSIDEMAAWTGLPDAEIVTSFADKIITPGLIDPHIHPILAALLLPGEFLTPEDWDLPEGVVKGATTRDEYMARLKGLISVYETRDEPLIVWGYHQLWHGEMDRATLDHLAPDRPVFVWHRSFHEIITNSAGLRFMGIDPEIEPTEFPAGVNPGHVSIKDGHFFETGLLVAFQGLGPVLMDPARLIKGLTVTRDMLHRGGITTFADMGLGIVGTPEMEWGLISRVFERDDTPMRSHYIPLTLRLMRDAASPQAVVARVDELSETLKGQKMTIGGHIKFVLDGAFFSQLMQMGPPGYLDGHEGAWVTEPEAFRRVGRAFWKAGYYTHIHVNGDGGLDVVLDALSAWQKEHPRTDHRTSLEHMGYARADQLPDVAALELTVSAQPWYLHLLSEKYSQHGLGPERASRMTPLGSLAALNVKLGLHSDLTMAPAQPLVLAWAAASRQSQSGQVMAADERLTVEQALRAITIDAAYILRMEDQVGSIEIGKKADFTILEADPFAVGADGLRDIEVWGTVFEGREYPR